jgi:hemerythrin superfamily protein
LSDKDQGEKMDIYDLLKKDHDELKPLLDQLAVTGNSGGDFTPLLQKIEALLVPHSRAEEAVFYNLLREIPAGKGVISHSYREHMEAEALLRTLQGLDKINIEWRRAAQKLRDAVYQHIAEEEDKVFPKARSLFHDDEAEQLATIFNKAKRIARKQGDLKNTMDMIFNMLPKRIRDFISQKNAS